MGNLKIQHNQGKPSKVCAVRHIAVPAPYSPAYPLKTSCRHSVNAIPVCGSWILRRITCGLSCRPLPAGVRESGGSGVRDSKDPQDMLQSPHAKTASRTVCSHLSGRVRHGTVKRKTERFCKPVCIIPCVLPLWSAPAPQSLPSG